MELLDRVIKIPDLAPQIRKRLSHFKIQERYIQVHEDEHIQLLTGRKDFSKYDRLKFQRVLSPINFRCLWIQSLEYALKSLEQILLDIHWKEKTEPSVLFILPSSSTYNKLKKQTNSNRYMTTNCISRCLCCQY